jgi:thiamine biosynthesis lipoprotein
MGVRSRFPALAFAALLPFTGCVEPTHLERTWEVLGRSASAEVYTTARHDAPVLLDKIEDATRRVEAIMAFDRSDSELNRLNREAVGEYYSVESRDLYRAVRLGLDYAKATQGIYDPTIGPLTRLYSLDPSTTPGDDAVEAALESVGWAEVTTDREALAIRFRHEGMLIDLAGMVEGYALDVAARNFATTGSRAGLLRLGGYAVAWNKPPGNEAWAVEIADPRAPGRALVELDLASRAVASAAAPEAGRPILDPRTGRPAASNVAVAVVIADSAADAGAVVRALIVGGSATAGGLLAKTHRVETVLLVEDPEGTSILASASLQGRLRFAEELLARTSGGTRYLLPPADL